MTIIINLNKVHIFTTLDLTITHGRYLYCYLHLAQMNQSDYSFQYMFSLSIAFEKA